MTHLSQAGGVQVSIAEEQERWAGLIGGRCNPIGGLHLQMLPQDGDRSTAGGSGTFLAVASDRRKWWVKPPNHLQGGKVLVSEHVVGRLGMLVGAPMCEMAVIEITPDVAGWEFRPGSALEPGFGNGSLAVSDAVESRVLDSRQRDDNRRRHVGVLALYDWCWGGDTQWLYCQTDDRRLYSHDHGWYFPETGPDWCEATLMAHLDEPHQAPFPTDDLDAAEARRLANTIAEITPEELATVLNSIPISWPVTNKELESLGCFLMHRAPAVAGRLSALVGGTP